MECAGRGAVSGLTVTSKMLRRKSRLNGCVRWKKTVGEIGEDGWKVGQAPGVQCLQGEGRLSECRAGAEGKPG